MPDKKLFYGNLKKVIILQLMGAVYSIYKWLVLGQVCWNIILCTLPELYFVEWELGQ